MFASSRWLVALLHIAIFATLSTAVDLAFTKPGFNNVAASGYPYFSVGQDVQISWTTPWEETTLVVFQNVNGKVYYEVLADTNSPSNTSVTWTASGVKSKPLAGATFHFYLQNSNNFNCNTCYINSRVFQITAATTTSTTRSAPRTTITSTPSGKTGMDTTALSSSTASAAAAGSRNGAEQGGSGSGNDLTIPLGVGLGAGIPVFLALCGILFMFFHIRRKRAEQQQEAYSEKGLVVGGYDDSTPSASTPPDRTSGQLARSSGRPESGALGPWQNSPSPTYDQQQYDQQQYYQQYYQQQQQEDWQRQRQAAYDEEDIETLPVPPGAAAGRPRHPSQKYDYLPFTPALPTQFEADESRQSSRHGRLDEFDFERPGYQNADEMSELRQSIHGGPGAPDDRPRSQKSQFSYHANRASIGDVSEIPQVPQPVHGYDVGIGEMSGDSNWPLR